MIKQIGTSFLFFGVCYLTPAKAILLDVSPAFQDATEVSSFSVDINASGVPSHQVITFFDLLLGYNATLIRPVLVTFSDALGVPDFEAFPDFDLDFDPSTDPVYSSGYTGVYSNAVRFGSVSVLNASTGANPSDFDYLKTLQTPQPFTLASITFEVLPFLPPKTETLLQLMDDSFFALTPGEFDVKGKDDEILTTTVQSGSALVPIPGTPLLLLSAVVALIAQRRWRSIWPPQATSI